MSIDAILNSEGVSLSPTPNASDEHIAEMKGTFGLEGIAFTAAEEAESRAFFEGKISRAQVVANCIADIKAKGLM